MINVVTFLASALFVIVCLFLIFVVLIQKGEGGGLGGLAGGSAVDTAFGAKADMTWKRATFIAAMLFVVLSLALGVLKRPQSVTRRAATPPPPPPPAVPVTPPGAPAIPPAAPAVPNPPAHIGS